MPKRILEGEVVSDKTDKTITVLVERRFMHPVYKKYVRRTDKYAAHDAANRFKIGDQVRIIECPPVSKTKRWTVITEDESSDDSTSDKKPAAQKDAGKKDAKKAAATKAAKKKDS